MSEFSGSRRQDPPPSVAVGAVWAGGNAIIAGKIGTLIIQNVQRAQKDALPSLPEPPPIQPDDPRVYVTLAALAHLPQPQTCFYLGRRYGLTPHGSASDLLDELEIGARPPSTDSLAEAMGWLAGQTGLVAARRHLAEHYSHLDEVDSEVDQELKDLAALTAGHVLVTGSYSARIQNALGPGLSVVQDDGQLGSRLAIGRAKRAHLLMLHGTEQDFQNAMVTADEVATYEHHRPLLAAEVVGLLEQPWIVFGAEKKADSTFRLLASNVCHRLGMSQRPIFVVDPRPENELSNEWPRAALRHVGLTAAQFLSLARSGDHVCRHLPYGLRAGRSRAGVALRNLESHLSRIRVLSTGRVGSRLQDTSILPRGATHDPKVRNGPVHPEPLLVLEGLRDAALVVRRPPGRAFR